jgi:competence protein ComEA
MAEPNKLPPEIENRLTKIREQFKPLEISEPKKINYWTQLDLKSLFAIAIIGVSAMVLSLIWWSGSQWTNSTVSDEAQPLINTFEINDNENSKLPSEIYVHIFGDVKNPGVYKLPSGSRVFEAVAAAGGQSNQRTLEINLAEILNDGDQIFIGEESHLTTKGSDTSSKKSSDKQKCVDINSADIAQLDTLPGIGPVMAQKIVDWRTDNGNFKSINQLNEVKGIGSAKYADLEKLVCI